MNQKNKTIRRTFHFINPLYTFSHRDVEIISIYLTLRKSYSDILKLKASLDHQWAEVSKTEVDLRDPVIDALRNLREEATAKFEETVGNLEKARTEYNELQARLMTRFNVPSLKPEEHLRFLFICSDLEEISEEILNYHRAIEYIDEKIRQAIEENNQTELSKHQLGFVALSEEKKNLDIKLNSIKRYYDSYINFLVENTIASISSISSEVAAEYETHDDIWPHDEEDDDHYDYSSHLGR